MPQPPDRRLVTEASLAEQVQDLLNTAIVGGSGIGIAYDDVAGTLTITGIYTAETAENVRNTIATALVAGTGVTIVNNGANDTITISSSAGLDTEAMQDAVAAMILESSGLTAVYDDAAGTYTISAAGLAAVNHTHISTQITDFTEAVQDVVGAFLASGTGISVTYDDVGNVATITAIDGGGSWDGEQTRDTIGAALIGVGVVTVTANDAGDTISISSTATQNSTDAQLRDRSTHTGTQPSSSISDLTESVQDIVGAFLAAGTGVTVTYNDAGNVATIASTITQYTDEMARDAIGTALTAGAGITVTPNDAGDTITIAVAAHNHTSSQVTDLTETVQDIVATMLIEGTGLSAVYDDTAGTYTITNTVTDTNTTDPEVVRDTIGTALVAGTGIQITVDDLNNTITIANTAGSGGLDLEAVQDAVATMLLEGFGLSSTYDDTNGTYTISVNDTGWIDLPYSTGYDGTTVGQLRYRVRNGVCYLAGGGRRTAGTWAAGQNGTMFTISTGLPSQYWPEFSHTGASRGTAGRVGFWNITTGGSIQITPERDSAGTDWVSCGNASWPVPVA